MKNTYVLIFLLLGLSCPAKVAAQNIKRIPAISVSVRMQTAQVVVTTTTSDSLRKRPFRYGPPADWITNHVEPLYIIDDKSISNENLKKINPSDIENIEVIKGNQAAVLYGQKGINGVLIITTKKRNANKQKEKGHIN